MKPREIREKTPGELNKLEMSLREELFRLRLKKAAGQLDKSHRITFVKKDLARVLTLRGKGTV